MSFTRVVKVGGSLLDRPDLGKRLQAWLDQQSPATNVLLAGGGTVVDQIRSDPEFQDLSELDAHWKCVDLMSDTANYLAKTILTARLQTHIPFTLPFTPVHKPVVFSCATWLKHLEPLVDGTRLPESWDVTSDSIAARLAICVGADELILLKSADPPTKALQILAAEGYIDRFFPKLAYELPPWRMVNLLG